MTIFLLIVIMAMAAIIFQQRRYRKRLIKGSLDAQRALVEINDAMAKTIKNQREEYAALEVGTQELVDNYENDFLDLQEKLEGANNGARYDRERLEEAETRLSSWTDLVNQHAEKCDMLVQDIADSLIIDILPPSE